MLHVCKRESLAWFLLISNSWSTLSSSLAHLLNEQAKIELESNSKVFLLVCSFDSYTCNLIYTKEERKMQGAFTLFFLLIKFYNWVIPAIVFG